MIVDVVVSGGNSPHGAHSATLAGNGGDHQNPFKPIGLNLQIRIFVLPPVRSRWASLLRLRICHVVKKMLTSLFIKNTQSLVKQKGYQPLGYEVDSELSQKYRSVFYNKKKTTAVIAYLPD